MSIKAVGNKIESLLAKIREEIGASKSKYDAKYVEIEISGHKLNELAKVNPGKPIIINGKFRMAYIKDHSYYQFQNFESAINSHPNDCLVKANKVHFYYCTTLVNMKARGREARYYPATQITNTRSIDYGTSTDLKVRLAYCKNCINILCSAARTSPWQYFQYLRDKDTFAEWGDANDYMNCAKELYNSKDIATAVTHAQKMFLKTIERKN